MLAAGVNDVWNSTMTKNGKPVHGKFGLPPLEQWLAYQEDLARAVSEVAAGPVVKGARGRELRAHSAHQAALGRQTPSTAAPRAPTHPPTPHSLTSPHPIPTLLPQIRRAYPTAALVQLAWPNELLLGGICSTEQALVYHALMGAAFSRLQAAGLRDVYFMQLSGDGIDARDWCQGHPNLASHAAIAAQVQRFLSGVLPGWAPLTRRGA